MITGVWINYSASKGGFQVVSGISLWYYAAKILTQIDNTRLMKKWYPIRLKLQWTFDNVGTRYEIIFSVTGAVEIICRQRQLGREHWSCRAVIVYATSKLIL